MKPAWYPDRFKSGGNLLHLGNESPSLGSDVLKGSYDLRKRRSGPGPLPLKIAQHSHFLRGCQNGRAQRRQSLGVRRKNHFES